MNRRLLIVALAIGSMILFASQANAQFYPGGYGYDSGAAALMGSSYVRAAGIEAPTQYHDSAQQATMAQNAMVQGGIRNTLSSQADSRTNAILNQRQADKDWWFQIQAQQSARDNTAYSTAATPMSMGARSSSGFGPSGGPPKASMDIINWPVALRDDCFASERTQVEDPYRRTPPKLSTPTPDDFRKMVGVIEDMKAVLEWKLREGIRTSDYDAAKAFLNQMEREAASHASR